MVALGVWGYVALPGPTPAPSGVNYDRDVLPILSQHCFKCHGADVAKAAAGLRLDSMAGAMHTSGIIIPGSPAKSYAIKRIIAGEMPPSDSGIKPVRRAALEVLRLWIKQGAHYNKHWSYVVPTMPTLPPVSNPAWCKNPIDQFVMAKLDAAGLKPEREADRDSLALRAAETLTGLPPSQVQLDTFRQDTKPGAYERLVDQLMANPAYGEHEARYWLDAVRYGDTHGLQLDNERGVYPYRDWVIRAYNQDLPFDKFVEWQLAGDLLSKPTTDQRVATGYVRMNLTTDEGGAIEEEFLARNTFDRVDTTSTVLIGLTVQCAKCHDHKYDPIKQSEYYRLSAYFNSIAETGEIGEGIFNPVLNLAAPAQREKVAALKAVEDTAQRERNLLDKELRDAQPAWEAALAKNGGMPGQVEWHPIAVEDALSENGATLTKLPDDSLLVGGRNPDTDDLVVTTITSMPKITAFRIEVLPDDSLPAKGPGRAADGSWMLSEIQVLGDGVPVSLRPVRADAGQSEWPLKDAIDGKDETGWRIGPPAGQAHEAVFELKDVFGYRPDRMVSFRLQFHAKERQRVIGRFRLSLTGSPAELLRPMPDEARAALAIAPAQRSVEQIAALTDYYLASEPRLIDARKKFADAKAARLAAEEDAPRAMVMRDRPEPRQTFILVKGAYDKHADPVTHGTPAILPALPADAPPNRLALARWLVSPEQPLTARVTVNRFWQMFFGRGLVKTTEDFGMQGDKPTHPELLDWLAREFIESGWDVKHIHRLIVTSATYRQESKVPPGMSERDPENQLLARGPRFRLPSWMLRDQALAAAGLLVEKTGGRPVKVYQPAGVWEDATFGMIKYKQDHGGALYRRSLYIFWRRIVGPTLFFDVAARQNCTVKVGRTNTPLHALVTLNDVTYVEAARALGERMLKEGGSDDAARLAYGFRLCTARRPSMAEAQLLASSLARFRAEYQADPSAAAKLIAAGESKPDAALPAPELAAQTSLALLLLNLDETLTKE